MAQIETRRMTHRYAGDLVVFLIGMRVNRWWRPDLWWPVITAMPRMLVELLKDPESGFLGYRFTLAAGGPLLVQYWSSIDKLYDYAANPQSEHRPAWAAFNRRVRKVPGSVGIWHETYVVDRAESIYVGMPPVGLGKATELAPVTGRTDAARARLAVSNEPVLAI